MNEKPTGVRLSPMEGLVIAKPTYSVHIETLIRAAKLYLDEKTGDEALAHIPREGMAYIFAPQPAGTDDELAVDSLWLNAYMLFAQMPEMLLRCKSHLIPYLLTNLCRDIFDRSTAGRGQYHSNECGYAFNDDEQEIRIRLSKSIDYCSYHIIEIVISPSGFSVAVNGCWRGSQQDPGPVYHPPENCYDAFFEYSNGRIIQDKRSGSKCTEAFKLWGIDPEKIAQIIGRKTTKIVA